MLLHRATGSDGRSLTASTSRRQPAGTLPASTYYDYKGRGGGVKVRGGLGLNNHAMSFLR